MDLISVYEEIWEMLAESKSTYGVPLAALT